MWPVDPQMAGQDGNVVCIALKLQRSKTFELNCDGASFRGSEETSEECVTEDLFRSRTVIEIKNAKLRTCRVTHNAAVVGKAGGMAYDTNRVGQRCLKRIVTQADPINCRPKAAVGC